MPFPLIPIAAQLGATALSSALSRRKRVKLPDNSGLINAINQSGEKQRNLIAGVRPQTTALGQQYKLM